MDRAIEIAKAAAGLEDQEVEIVEYPNFKQKFSMLKSNFMGAELLDILPPELAKELEVLQIIPMLDEDQYLFLMPYKITIQ